MQNPVLESWSQDARHALRALLRARLFTLTAVTSLAIAVAGNATIFSLADALLLRSLPGVADPPRLVDVGRTQGGSGFDNLSYPNYADLRDRNTAVDLAGYRTEADPLGLAGAGGATRVHGSFVTSNYFRVIGVRMVHGRAFAPDEDRPGAAQQVAVVSHRLWQTHFAGASDIVGRQIRLNGQPVTVVGVAASGFHGHTISRADLWLPLTTHPALTGQDRDLVRMRAGSWFAGVGRLRPDVTVSQARAQLQALGAELQREHPEDNRDRGVAVAATRPLPAGAAEVVTIFIGILFAMVGLILLIACANVGGMMLARGAGQAHDVALRLALGAGRHRVVRQLVVESLLLALAGGVVGVGAAVALVALVQALVPVLPISSLAIEFRVDWRVVMFSTAVTTVAGVTSGLVPALQAARTSLTHTLKADAKEGARPQRLRRVFVAAQVAVSMVLVVCALLLGSSLRNADRISPGFDPVNVDAVELDLTLGGYQDVEASLAFSERLIDALRQLPGVDGAASSIVLPLTGNGNSLGGLRRVDRAAGDPSAAIRGVDWNVISPAYFETLRIPLRQGRAFTAADRAGAPDVAIVNETLARQAWPAGDALGQLLVQSMGPDMRMLRVVGIARDAKYRSVGEGPRPFIYVPMAQQFRASQWLMIRTTGRTAVPQLRTLLRQMDPNLPLVQVTTLADAAALGLLPSRLATAIAATVGGLGLLLAAIGIYGVIAYSVAQRTREIGVRMALGATSRAVIRLVGRQALGVAGIGAVIGLVLAAGASQALRMLLFGIDPMDPALFAGAAALFALVAVVSCAIPARRAVRIDPAAALRAE